MNQRGFTLNELLVVTGILAALALITLASVNSSRSKGSDTSVKANLASIQIQAENFYSASWNGVPPGSNLSLKNSYGAQSANGKCVVTGGIGPANNSVFKDSAIQTSLTAIANLIGASNMQCNNIVVPPQYAVIARISDGNYWCIDNTGYAGVFTGDPDALIGNPVCVQ